jgi:hypothetical protein
VQRDVRLARKVAAVRGKHLRRGYRSIVRRWSLSAGPGQWPVCGR